MILYKILIICAKIDGRVILTISLPIDCVAMRSSRVIVPVVFIIICFLFYSFIKISSCNLTRIGIELQPYYLFPCVFLLTHMTSLCGIPNLYYIVMVFILPYL